MDDADVHHAARSRPKRYLRPHDSTAQNPQHHPHQQNHAAAWNVLPLELIEAGGLARRRCDRGGEAGIQFRWEEPTDQRALPVWHDGRLRLVVWGNRRGESRVLPVARVTWIRTVEEGGWKQFGAEECVIPATMALDGSIWFCIREGIRGVLVRDERGCERVFPICEPASFYYRIMSRGEWMPVLIGERY